MRGLAGGGYEEDAGADVTPVSAPPDSPLITLGPLETKSGGDELSDGVQSMDVRWAASLIESVCLSVKSLWAASLPRLLAKRPIGPLPLLIHKKIFNGRILTDKAIQSK